jgi:hypothetical protein
MKGLFVHTTTTMTDGSLPATANIHKGKIFLEKSNGTCVWVRECVVVMLILRLVRIHPISSKALFWSQIKQITTNLAMQFSRFYQDQDQDDRLRSYLNNENSTRKCRGSIAGCTLSKDCP